jgi:hypothetical protein
MIITGAFLAEAAAVVDNKLDVRGGVLVSCQVRRDRIARVTVVVLTQPEAGDKAPKLKIEVFKPSGETHSSQIGEIPKATLGTENGFAFFPCEIHAETDGRYMLVVTSGSSSVSLPLRVHPVDSR